jgi:predicted ATPase/DNA-binding CsgD family transcriptional regulator
LLQEDVRLLTLTGPGGSGKTRLAIACAERLLPIFPDGVYFVDLAPLRDSRDVVSAIARGLQLSEPWPADVGGALARLLERGQVLLVLDNFEHVLPSATEVSRLLASCSNLKVLVTSRAPTHLRWEHELPIPPLAVPDAAATTDLSRLSHTAAVALFVERAQAARPDFALTAENASDVAQICIRTDGLPLALELAAGRSKSLAAGDLLRLLAGGLELLRTGAPDTAARHRTLITTIGWSHDLLTPDERKLFRRLALFANGWTLEAARNVCTLEDLDPSDIFDTLDRLVDQSLVQMHESGGRARYRFLETMRQFAQTHLEASRETAEIARRQAVHFATVAEALGGTSGSEFVGPRATGVRAGFELEYDYMHAALLWSIENGEADLAMRLARYLAPLWYVRGAYARTRGMLEQVLAMPGAQTPTVLRATLLNYAANAALADDPTAARGLVDQALAIGRTVNDAVQLAAALQNSGLMSELQDDLEGARVLGEKALDVFRSSGERRREATQLTNLGRLAWKQNDFTTARTLAERALAIAREIGSIYSTNNALLGLGNALRDQGQPSRARAALEEAVALSGTVGDQRSRAFCLDALAYVALRQGQRAEAQTCFAESLRLCWEIGEHAKVADSLDAHARFAAMQGQRESALRLAGAASGLRERLGIIAPPQSRTVRDEWFDEVRKTLDDDAIAAFLASGQTMTTDQAVAYALQPQEPAPSDTKLDAWSPLTAREHEVARLVARGFTNRQIAAELVVTEATAAKHVENIREKLGLNSRIQVGAWVRDHETTAAPPAS